MQWAKERRVLSRESSAMYGKFKPFSYQVEPMLEISNPTRQKIVLMWGSQLGKSEIINNAIGYFIDAEPSTILFLLPSEDLAEDYSKRRLAPMFRDCPSLKSKIHDDKDASNTILIKNYDGGSLNLVGSNSPSKLASKPIRVLLVDEVDRCLSTKEGSALKLAEKRTITFNERKIIEVSSPTLKGASQIEADFLAGDQRYFYVDCPHCGFSQTLKFENIIFEWDEQGVGLPHTARYRCCECGTLLSEQEKNAMVKAGKWIAKNPTSQVASFYLNAVYSAFFTMSDIVHDFLDSRNDQSKMQVFINTIKAECFEPPSIKLDDEALAARRESYEGHTLPTGVQFITAGVDVQDDRIELNITGWGAGYEGWHIAHIVIAGNPRTNEPWQRLYTELKASFHRANQDGTASVLKIAVALIDSGFLAERVYEFCLLERHFIATKGASETHSKKEFISKIKQIVKGVNFISIGTYEGKCEWFKLLGIKEPGIGFQHFNQTYSDTFFKQLKAEQLLKLKNKQGYEALRWQKVADRNEAIDLCVLCLAGAKLYKAYAKKSKPRKVSK